MEQRRISVSGMIVYMRSRMRPRMVVVVVGGERGSRLIAAMASMMTIVAVVVRAFDIANLF
jgi:hypothetical protein